MVKTHLIVFLSQSVRQPHSQGLSSSRPLERERGLDEERNVCTLKSLAEKELLALIIPGDHVFSKIK